MKSVLYRPLLAAGLCCALLMSAPASSASEDSTVQAVLLRPGERLTLDGTLSHAAWRRAPAYDRFQEFVPVNGAAPAQATRVQVLFDLQALYVGVTVLDSRPEQIRAPLVRNDAVNRTQDFVVVYIDAIGQRSAAQFFRVNAAGSRADGMHTASDDSEDFAPDFDWDAATARNAQGWTAVLRLPFASLRFAPGQQDWRIMVARRLPREQFHLMTSVRLPRDTPNFIAQMQSLSGVRLPEQTSFLTLRPSLALRRSSHAGQHKDDAAASLDVKWRPQPQWVIDGTLNPDFSQVALDVPQLAGNSRFALFLAEKRPFFFESVDLLRTPTEAMYTRSFTQPRWGLRATWRTPEGAGTAFAIDDKGGGQVLLPGAYGTDAVEQPASKALVARLRREEGSLAWGGLLATRQYAQGRGDNQVLGPDVAWQLSPQWRLRGQWLHSRTTAFSDGHGQLAPGPAVQGDRWLLRLLRQTGVGETTLTLDQTDAGFRHDSGFVNQTGVRRIEAFQSLGWNRLGPFNQFFVNVSAFQVRDRTNDRVVQEVVRPGLWLAAAHNLEAWFEYFARSAVRTAPHSPLLQERFVSTGLVMTPASWFPLVDLNIDHGDLADTTAGAVRPGLRWSLSGKLRPLPALELEPNFRGARIAGGGGRYEESTQQWLAVWHFNATQNLRAIAQRSSLQRDAEPGLLAAASTRRSESLTWAWRRSAGTLMYVGATRSQRGQAPATSEVFVKLQTDVDDWGLRSGR